MTWTEAARRSMTVAIRVMQDGVVAALRDGIQMCYEGGVLIPERKDRDHV